MIIIFDKKFDKKFKKISVKIQEKFFDRLRIFKNNKFEKILNNHKLHGEYEGCNSINITSNYRAVFKIINKENEEFCVFITIGTHPGLYE